MNRREFLAAIAVARYLPTSAAAATTSPGSSQLRRINEEDDEFACEKAAKTIEAHLSRLIETRALPLADGFHGISPLPMRYEPIAAQVERALFSGEFDGFSKWIDSLGPVRYANFFALPGDIIRYEIASAGEYRAGQWKQVWVDGRLREFSPIEEFRTKSAKPLFRDVTAHCLGSCASFRDQLSAGNTWWRTRLDVAAGIDIYASNGIAVGDIDNDGIEEVYVCQQGGLPNRLYKNRGGVFEDIT